MCTAIIKYFVFIYIKLIEYNIPFTYYTWCVFIVYILPIQIYNKEYYILSILDKGTEHEMVLAKKKNAKQTYK